MKMTAKTKAAPKPKSMSKKRGAPAPATTSADAKKEGKQQPTKKKRRMSKKAKVLGLSNEQWDMINAAEIKKQISVHSRNLSAQVSGRWYYGHEEQSLTCDTWINDVKPILQGVLTIGSGLRKGLRECVETLNVIGNSMRHLQANPSRTPVIEMLTTDWILKLPWGGIKTFKKAKIDVVFSFVWIGLLRTFAIMDNGDGDVIFEMIKYAHDNGVRFDNWDADSLQGEDDDDEDTSGGDNIIHIEGNTVGRCVESAPDGNALLLLVAKKDKWNQLESNKNFRTFKMRNVVDHRHDSN